jgi:hypothetical protein
MHDVRQPAVCGRFYAAERTQLIGELSDYMGPADDDATSARVVVVPHAGYIYSGRVAGRTYAQVELPEVVVVLCPNHTGLGVPRSLWPRGAWRTPLGDVIVDAELASRIAKLAELSEDSLAHLHEHAIEVQLPFLQYRRPDVQIVPICLAYLTLEHCLRIGTGLARAVSEARRPVLIVSSTDMSHYIPAERARKLDALALECIEVVDPQALYDVVTRHDISMCGFIPTTVALAAARELGADCGRIVTYANSGDASGDYDRVVGYAGAVI